MQKLLWRACIDIYTGQKLWQCNVMIIYTIKKMTEKDIYYLKKWNERVEHWHEGTSYHYLRIYFRRAPLHIYRPVQRVSTLSMMDTEQFVQCPPVSNRYKCLTVYSHASFMDQTVDPEDVSLGDKRAQQTSTGSRRLQTGWRSPAFYIACIIGVALSLANLRYTECSKNIFILLFWLFIWKHEIQ